MHELSNNIHKNSSVILSAVFREPKWTFLWIKSIHTSFLQIQSINPHVALTYIKFICITGKESEKRRGFHGLSESESFQQKSQARRLSGQREP